MEDCKLTFNPPLELVSDYAPINSEQQETDYLWLKKIKVDILIKCLSDNSSYGDFYTYQLYDDLKSKLDLFKRVVSTSCQNNIYDDIEKCGNVTFYGDKYCSLSNKPDIEECELSLIEDLMLISKVVKTDNYFDDNSNFNNKRLCISEKLLDFEDVVYSYCIFDFMENFMKYKKTNYIDTSGVEYHC